MKKLLVPLCLLLAGLGWVAFALMFPGNGDAERVGVAESDSGFLKAYWEHPVATKDAPPKGWQALEANLHPKACAQCHEAQFEDWKDSLHAHAYSPGLIGQFPGMGHAAANDCLICHAPLKEQMYVGTTDMMDSLKQMLAHQEGFDRKAQVKDKPLPLRHAGVTCASCHVRGWRRFGPPPKESRALGQIKGSAHGGFTAMKEFEQSAFCASCHQFPQSMAINGKPLENTLEEWKQSRFEREGVQCQNCHMPERRHEFRGIHDPEMVRRGLDFKLKRSMDGGSLTITSRWIGHAFPTYVTPEVIIQAEALDRKGKQLRAWQWEIVREVAFTTGWTEIRDVRLMPGESRSYLAESVPEGSKVIRFQVRVIPDQFYKGIYQHLLAGELENDARALINRALAHADENDYTLYEEELELP
ncbi:MAG: multiheme c-type cytochrome [Mariprofundaceae bacterium]